MQNRALHNRKNEVEKTDDFEELDDVFTDQETSQAPRLRLISTRPRSPRTVSSLAHHQASQFHSPHQLEIIDSFSYADLPALLEDWLEWCEDENRSPQTLELRRVLLGRLMWFLDEYSIETVDEITLRRFFRHLIKGHLLPQGRWGRGSAAHGRQALRPATLLTYYAHFGSFFNYLVKRRYLSASLMNGVPRQKEKTDQVDPFTEEQINALLRQAARSYYPRRNEALFRFLLDTGVRASELCNLTFADVHLFEARARVLGKGNKYRTVRWGHEAAVALRAYVNSEYSICHHTDQPSSRPRKQLDYRPTDPLFISEGGNTPGHAMTVSGLRQLVKKTGKRAGIQITKCTTHTFRHTFAIMFLRAGGSLGALQEILGHTNINTTMMYVKFASADIERQQRQFSPGDRMSKRK